MQARAARVKLNEFFMVPVRVVAVVAFNCFQIELALYPRLHYRDSVVPMQSIPASLGSQSLAGRMLLVGTPVTREL
jgi:hypothetical protein